MKQAKRRLERPRTGRPARLLEEMPEGFPVDQAWDNLNPVGREIVDGVGSPKAASSQMQEFMASAPAGITPETLKGLIEDGRD